MLSRLARYLSAIGLSAILAAPSSNAQTLPQDYKAHRESLLRQLAEFISAGQAAAAAEFTRRELEKTARLGRNDPRRGNAVEISLQLAMLGDDRALTQSALSQASELVRIRRSQTPQDAELLALALLTQGTILFALKRSAEADRAFEERMQVLRRAYAANDPKLAEHFSATARAMRRAGGAVVWVQTTVAGAIQHWANYQRQMLSPRRQEARLIHLDEQSEGFKLFPTLEVLADDLRIKKITYSAFIQGSSDIEVQLEARDIDLILVAGTLTNVCCESSARDAMMLGYNVIMLSDANATLTDEEHAAALNTFSMFFGDVMATKEVIARLGGSLQPRNANRNVLPAAR